MSEDPTAGPDLTPMTGDELQGPEALLARIRAKHEGKVRHRDVFPPRWEGDVAIRCGRVPKKLLAQIGSGRHSGAVQAAKLLTAACLEVLLRDDDGRLQPLGIPAVGIDPRLAHAFGLPADDPAKTCQALYADDVPLIAQAQEVYDWITGKSLEVLDLDELEDELGEETAAI